MHAKVEVVMMPNGFVGCWLINGPDDGTGRTTRTGMSEQETERVGREWAKRLGVPFRRVKSWQAVAVSEEGESK